MAYAALMSKGSVADVAEPWYFTACLFVLTTRHSRKVFVRMKSRMSFSEQLIAALLVYAASFCSCNAQTNRNTAIIAVPAPLRTIALDPSMSYCTLLKSAMAGDEYVFAPGTYR